MLLENIKQLHETLDYMQEGLVFHTPDTQIAFANKAASELLGLSKEELQTKTAHNTQWEFVDKDENKLNIEDFPVNIALKTKKSFKNYVIGQKSSDKTVWFNVNGELIYSGNTLEYVLITFSDITKFKTTQDELILYKHIVENADTGITVSDITKEDQPLIYANPMFEKMTGYPVKDVIGTNCRFLQGDDREQEGRFIIADAIKNQLPCEVELKNYKKDGTPFNNLLNLAPLFTDDNKLKYFIGIQHDITKLKNLEFQFKKLINTQDNMIILTNGEELSFANNKFLEFFDYDTLEAFQEKHSCICELFIESDNFFYLGKVENGLNWVEEILKLGHADRVVSMMDTNFNLHAFSVSINQFEGDNYIISFANISQTMLQNIELLEKTIRDKLTGAFNREYFEQNYKNFIQEYNKKGSVLALAVLDIDHFKAVNDTYGHDVGDEVLIKFVETIEKFSRKNDILIRWGGEEFILILKVKSQSDLFKALDHLRKVIEMTKFPTVGTKTCSIGGTVYQDSEDITDTIKRADEGVYEAKAAGRNQVVIL